MLGCATSRSRRTLLSALAMAAGLSVHAAPARAEIIDFDPATEDVPVLVSPSDLARYDALTAAGFWYMISTPSPGGRHVFAWDGSGEGFVDLATGAITRLAPPEDMPAAAPISDYVWFDAVTLATLSLEVKPGEEGQPPIMTYYQVTMNAVTGAMIATPVDVTVDGDIVGVSPDLQRLVVMKHHAEEPMTAEEVIIGPKFGGPEPDAPEGIDVDALPGRVGARVLKRLALQHDTFDLVLQNRDGTGAKTLMSPPAESSASVTWSPDGRRVVIDLSTLPDWDGDRRRDNNPPFAGLPNLGSVAVRESLGQIAPVENPIVTGASLNVFDAASGDAVKTIKGIDLQQGLLGGIQLSPTGGRALLSIYQRSELRDRQHPVYSNPRGVEWHLLDADLNVVRRIDAPGLDNGGTSAAWMGDDTLVFAVPDELDTRIVAVDAASGVAMTLWDQPGGIFQALPAGAGAVFSRSTVDQPWELYTVTASPDGTATVRQATSANLAARMASGIRSADVSWTTTDGQTIHGLYVYPETAAFPPASPQPLIVWQLGGPGGQMLNDFGNSVESLYSLLPNFGVPVLVANAAGRNVKSAAFYSDMAQGRNFGQLDIQQIKEGVDDLVRKRIVDPARVGISGCSYGGYFTLQSIRTYPGFYAAANPQCSLVDLTEEFTFGYTPFVAYLMGRAPMADPAEYLKDSPFYGAKDVTTPSLIFHGTKDFLPVPLINNIHDELDGRDVDVTFFRAAGYGHGLGMATDREGNPIMGSPEKGQRYAFQLQLRFFRDHLGVGEIPPLTRPARVFLPVAGQSAVFAAAPSAR